MNANVDFRPGTIVRARGREWIVLPESATEKLHLRALGGGSHDHTILCPALERVPVEHATFPPPDPARAGRRQAGDLIRESLILRLRNGAGPFRSFGNIAVEPRAYQLVPLMLALRQQTIRLLIADDVGIGKTIEAALILRELVDRGEVQRSAVLCPPHLCEQWQAELESRFHIRSVIVRSASAARLERGLPQHRSLFEEHPHTIVSLDFIKSERRRDEFRRVCPEFVIVDEAHTCTLRNATQRQQRYELLRSLADDDRRHLLLLTATPHSGDEGGFFNLLGLLDRDFIQLGDAGLGETTRRALRERLAGHFVQRRRPDIAEWHEARLFPDRETGELTYQLTGDWGELFQQVLDYAREIVADAEDKDRRRQRISWWAALALMRCVSSSPRAAAAALRTRLVGATGDSAAEAGLDVDEVDRLGRERTLDGEADGLSVDDAEPAARMEDTARLERLLGMAVALEGKERDPKIARLIPQVRQLLEDGFHPVVFCRYIATAQYVAEALGSELGSDIALGAVTGRLPPSEREARVAALTEHDARVLVATDCLSEGINLQAGFDAVVHYDLSWNPTRHEQREGRVDRFGQSSERVRCLMLYGEDNPVDGAVLQVIIRKAEAIRKELGVTVPMPDDEERVTEALMRAVLLRRGELQSPSLALDFGDLEAQLDVAWTNARDRMKSTATVFAQKRLSPGDVLPEWERMQSVLGSEAAVERFVLAGFERLNARAAQSAAAWRLPIRELPPALRERLETNGIAGSYRVAFQQPVPAGATFIHRTHPLVSVLAEWLIEHALDGNAPEVAARCGAIFTEDVTTRTTVWLLRLRSQLILSREGQDRTLLCEEALCVSVSRNGIPELLSPERAAALLGAVPAANMPDARRHRELELEIARFEELQELFSKLASDRAAELLDDHRRVRDASSARGRYQVVPLLPVDVMGVFLLLPRTGGQL